MRELFQDPQSRVVLLQAHAARLRGRDTPFGIEVVAMVAAGHAAGREAAALMASGATDAPPAGMDVTGSLDDALALLRLALPEADWSLFSQRTRGAPDKVSGQGPFSMQIEIPGFVFCGDGWTAPACAINALLIVWEQVGVKR